jgi:hypothetical protein
MRRWIVLALGAVVVVAAVVVLVLPSDSEDGASAGETGPATPVATQQPAMTFAPLVNLAADEPAYPMDGRTFVRSSTLEWADGECGSEIVAIGPLTAENISERKPLTRVERVGGEPAYRHAAGGAGCRPGGREYAATEITRPFHPGRRAPGLQPDQGFYLDRMTDAAAGKYPTEIDGEVLLRGVPVYVEQRAERVNGKPGMRIVYWMLYAATKAVGSSRESHEGGWERVSVLLSRGPGDGRYLPVSMRFDEGGRERDVAWEEIERVSDGPGSATHPVAYSRPGSHVQSLEAGAEFEDCKRCAQWRTWKLVRDARAEPWYRFGGAWGTPGGSDETTGPLGPGAR